MTAPANRVGNVRLHRQNEAHTLTLSIKKTEPLPAERSGFVPTFQVDASCVEAPTEKLGGFGNPAPDDAWPYTGVKAELHREVAPDRDRATHR